ncbi:hypothetical protein [Selenomonas sp. AE3005]|nr:hypothetical protein [Selenomonas sp. AE3005]
MAKLEQRRYKDVHKYFYLTEKSVDCKCSQQIFFLPIKLLCGIITLTNE